MRRRQRTLPDRSGGLVTVVTAALAVMMVSAAVPAQAATLTNQDAKPHQIEVLFKSARRAHELAPGKTLAGFCAEGCIIRLNGSPEHDFELEGTERVSIEGGLVYYDGEEVKRKAETATSPSKTAPN